MMLIRRKKRVLKMLMICLLTFLVPYIVVSNLESQSLSKDRMIYFINTGAKSTIAYNSFSEADRSMVNETHKGDNQYMAGTELFKPDELPLTIQYCNNPFKPLIGKEGHAGKRFKLRMVHVFLRHGDRTPMHSLRGQQNAHFNCNFSEWYNGTNMIARSFPRTMARYMGRQQMKSHFLNWALFPNKKKCQNSDLTSIGALQQINNGQFLSDRYFKQAGLFNDKLSLQSQVYVRSTTTPRTYQSAIAFVYGFLPSFNVSQFNIDHASNKYMCSTPSRAVLSCNCDYLSALEQKARKYMSAVHANSSEYAALKTTVADNLKLKDGISHMPWLSAILDFVVPSVCHNIQCTQAIDNTCMEGKLLQRIWTEYGRNQEAVLNDPSGYLLKFSSLQAYPVALEMVLRMKDLTEGRSLTRLVVYSGHDYTITSFLFLLGIHETTWPPYASRLIFELFESESKKGSSSFSKFYFRLLYNGVDITKNVSFCKGKTFKGLCKFKLLTDFVFGHMLRRFGYTSYSDACARRT